MILGRRGFEVTVAHTLRDAMDAIKTSPAYIILDLMLPDGSGETLLKVVRAESPATWIGITTGVDDPDRLQNIKQLNPSTIIRKPIDVMKLLSALQVK